jgi:hypothetical protein
MMIMNELPHLRADSLLERARGLAVTEEQVQVTPEARDDIDRPLVLPDANGVLTACPSCFRKRCRCSKAGATGSTNGGTVLVCVSVKQNQSITGSLMAIFGRDLKLMLFRQEDKKAMMEAAYLAATAPKPKAKKGKKGKKGGKSRPTTSQSKK